jgi:uncharacterized membrane protein
MSRQTVQESIVINAPAHLVWEVTSDPATFVEGIDWVYEAKLEEDGPMRLGSVYVERAKPGLKEGTYRWEITAFDPPRRIVHSHASGELEADLEVLYEALDENTTGYTQIMKFRALPVLRPLGFILERTLIKKRMQRDFKDMILPNFKRIVEERHRARLGKS